MKKVYIVFSKDDTLIIAFASKMLAEDYLLKHPDYYLDEVPLNESPDPRPTLGPPVKLVVDGTFTLECDVQPYPTLKEALENLRSQKMESLVDAVVSYKLTYWRALDSEDQVVKSGGL